MQQAMPHVPGGQPVYTTYTYDAIGRTLTTVAPDGASTTSYAYQGNQVQVIDPAGKWKLFAMDTFGNLSQVTEPNPTSAGPPPFNSAPTSTPVLTPSPGGYTSNPSVSITSATPGATIRYTLDNSTPTATYGTVYTGPFSVSNGQTVKAIAYYSGLPNSSVISGPYTVSSGGGGGGGGSWYSTGGTWTDRMPVTLNYSQVSGGANLSNFPVLISVTSPNLKTTANGGYVGTTSGIDILFTGSDGLTKLNHEIESYDGVNGILVAWVQVPTLSYTANTSLYVYYGNSSASNQQTPNSVWDSNYKGVWHLSEASGNLNDSTSGANTGTASSVGRAAAEIAGGGTFDGTSSNVTMANESNFIMGSAVTEELWLKQTTSGGLGYIFHKYYDENAPAYWISGNGDQLRVGVTYSPGNFTQAIYTNAGWHNGNWHHVVMVFSASTVYLYFDGTLATSASVGGSSIADSGGSVTAGRFSAADGYYFAGSLDELRISNAARTAGWITTEYNNQSAPGRLSRWACSRPIPEEAVGCRRR